MGFDFRKSILVSKLSCLPKNLLWILTAFWKKSFWRWVLFLLWKLIKNNRKSAKIILIFFAVIETGSQNCIRISKGVLIGQTVWFLWPKLWVVVFTRKKGSFGGFIHLNPPKLPLLVVKTSTQRLGHKNQTVCPIKRLYEIWIHFFEPISMAPKKLKLFWQIFCYF